MTNAKTTRPDAGRSIDDDLRNIFQYAPIASIDERLLPSRVPSDPRSPHYPPLMQFLIAVFTIACGSQRKALVELRSGSRWQMTCERYSKLINHWESLPAKPPSDKQQDDFILRLRRRRSVLEALADDLFEVAWGQAVRQGQFSEHDKEPDFTKFDQRRLVFGDGVYIAPYSNVTTVLDRSTGELVAIGSRARSRNPRVQRTFTDPTLDGKTAVGINNVIIGTWTEDGRIVLLNDRVLPGQGNEATVARKMIDRLATRANGRVHTVVWDRIVQGAQIHDTMSQHRILLVTKPRARDPKSRTTDGYTARTAKAEDAPRIISKEMPAPLGTTAWAADRGFEIIATQYFRMPTPSRLTRCPEHHDLWVDAGGLFDVVRLGEDSGLVKRAQCRAVISTATNPTFERWELQTEWSLPCAAAGEHRFVTRAPAHPVQQKSQRAALELRPYTTMSDDFWTAHGKRNNTESHNAWYQRHLSAAGQARHLDIDAQFLDQLAAGVAVNATTWGRFRRRQRLQQDAQAPARPICR